MILAVSATTQGARALRINAIDATPFTVVIHTLPSHTSLTFESASCSAGTDPVFHLLDATHADLGYFGAQWAFEDNSGGGVHARVTLSAAPHSRKVALFVRAASDTTSGMCSLRRNGSDWLPMVFVGGRFLNGSAVTRSSTDRLRTQLLPGGSTMPGILGFGGGGPNNSTIAWTAFQDGLGNALEAALGTCASTPCPNTPTAKDTDRDGLTDFEEVFGVAGQRPDGRDDIALSRWGANPRQKDAFVEVDYMSDYGLGVHGSGMPLGENPFVWMRQNGSVEAWVDEILGVFVPTTPQNHLKHPVGHPAPPATRSLRVHLELGVPPLNPADEWKFGDYGGASHRVLDREARYIVVGSVAGVCVRINQQWSCGDATGLSTQATASLIGVLAQLTGQPIAVKPVAQVPGTSSWRVDVQTTIRGQPFTADLFLGVGGEGGAIERTWNGTDWSSVNTLVGHDNLPPPPPPAQNPQPSVLMRSQAPAMVTWPAPAVPGVPDALDSQRRTYALFPDTQGRLRFYRLQAAPYTWERIRSFIEVTHAKPFLEFRYLRTGAGQLRVDNTNQETMGGHFLLGYHGANGSGGTVARFMVSAYVDLANPSPPPWTNPPGPWRIDLASTRDFVFNSWSTDLPSTSMALYTDRSIDNVFGLAAWVRQDGDRVAFLPHADGAPNHAYLVRSDYRTMEDLVCWRLKWWTLGEPAANSLCGVVNVSD